MMHILFLSLSIFSQLALALPQQTTPPPPPAPPVTLKNVTFSGHGCQESNSLHLWFQTWQGANNTQSFHQTIDDFGPYSGPAVGIQWRRRRCDVRVELEIDKEWKIRVNPTGTNVQGFGRLATSKSVLKFSADYSWADPNVKSRSQFSLNGPLRERFRAYAPVVGLPVVGFPGPGVDSPCGGGVLSIRNEGSITEGENWYGEIGDPYEYSKDWIIGSQIEAWKC